MTPLINKILYIIVEGQAWLYANQLKLQTMMDGGVVTDEMFDAWRDEWMNESGIEFKKAAGVDESEETE